MSNEQVDLRAVIEDLSEQNKQLSLNNTILRQMLKQANALNEKLTAPAVPPFPAQEAEVSEEEQ